MQRVILIFAAAGLVLLGVGAVSQSGDRLEGLTAATSASDPWFGTRASFGLKYKVGLVAGVCAPLALLGVVAGVQHCLQLAWASRPAVASRAVARKLPALAAETFSRRGDESWAGSPSM